MIVSRTRCFCGSLPHNQQRGIKNKEQRHRERLIRLGHKLGIKKLDDWYSVDVSEVRKRATFIKYHYDSFFDALKTLFPSHNWNALHLSKQVPRYYWKDERTQRDALEKLGRDFGVKDLDDWYSVNSSTVLKELSFIRTYYNGSVIGALKTLYPHHNWNYNKKSKVPYGHWNDKDAQRSALERIGSERFGVKELDDWYSVPSKSVKNELSFIISQYKGSLSNALKNLYPQHDWDMLKFRTLPHGYWDSEKTKQFYHRLFLKWKKQHNIQHFRDWYRLPSHMSRVFQRASKGIFGSTSKMLKEWFPDTNWFYQIQGSAPESELQVFTSVR